MSRETFYKSAISCMSALTFFSLVRHLLSAPFAGDMDIYLRAVNDYLNGDNPYRADVLLLFIYHPYVLRALVFLHNFIALNISLPIAFLISTCFFFWQLVDYIQINKKVTKSPNEIKIYWVIFPALTLGSSGITSFLTGNVSVFIHFLLLGAFFWAQKNSSNSRIFIFTFFILWAAIIKPYFLAYLILLVYLTDIKRCIIASLTVVLLLATSWLSTMVSLPEMHDSFARALHQQTLKGGDVGFSFFGYFYRHFGTEISLLIHCAVILSAVWLISAFQKYRGASLRSEIIIPLAIVFIIILNPRMKVYDFPIAVLFTFVFLHLQNQLVFFKAVFLSSFVAFLPRLNNALTKLGVIEQIEFFTNWKLFDVLGFAIALFFSISSLRRAQSLTNSQTETIDRMSKAR